MKIEKKLAVFSVREQPTGSAWIRVGSAFENRDGSLNVYLDALPLNGKLHVREVRGSEALATLPISPEVTR